MTARRPSPIVTRHARQEAREALSNKIQEKVQQIELHLNVGTSAEKASREAFPVFQDLTEDDLKAAVAEQNQDGSGDKPGVDNADAANPQDLIKRHQKLGFLKDIQGNDRAINDEESKMVQVSERSELPLSPPQPPPTALPRPAT